MPISDQPAEQNERSGRAAAARKKKTKSQHIHNILPQLKYPPSIINPRHSTLPQLCGAFTPVDFATTTKKTTKILDENL